MRILPVDGSPDSVATLVEALHAALDGGPAAWPVPAAAFAPAVPPGPIGTDRPVALVIETSGSTGSTKRVLLSSSALRASGVATAARLGGPGRWLLALPAHHVAGAQVIVRALLAGHPPAVLETRDTFRPDRFVAAAAAVPGPRRYTSLVPTQLHRVLADSAATEALCEFDAVLVGGAATAPTLLTAARAAGARVVTTYGMSETAGGCVYDGVPLDGVRVRLEPGDGRIALAGPTLADGYLGAPALTAEAFVDGWFRTSDLGRWDSRALTVLGRADDVIVTGGTKVHPAAVERVLTAQPAVRAACVVGLPDPEWGQLVAAAVVLDALVPDALVLDADGPGVDGPHRAAAWGAAAWGAAVRAELGAAAVPRRVRVLDELPLRGVGKPDRAQVARLLTGPAVDR